MSRGAGGIGRGYDPPPTRKETLTLFGCMAVVILLPLFVIAVLVWFRVKK